MVGIILIALILALIAFVFDYVPHLISLRGKNEEIDHHAGYVPNVRIWALVIIATLLSYLVFLITPVLFFSDQTMANEVAHKIIGSFTTLPDSVTFRAAQSSPSPAQLVPATWPSVLIHFENLIFILGFAALLIFALIKLGREE